jgi:hypothetical protein
MQVMYYANEIRDFGAISKAEQEKLDVEEIDLASGLIKRLSSDEFEPEAIQTTNTASVYLPCSRKNKKDRLILCEALKRSMR